jgi:hypothetical protein
VRIVLKQVKILCVLKNPIPNTLAEDVEIVGINISVMLMMMNKLHV